MRALKVALVQAAPHWHDAAANRTLFDEACDQIDDADLVVLPEMFSTGFTMASREVAETMQGETVAWMRARAAALDTTIAGSVVIEDNGEFFNRLVWMPPDGDAVVYDKRHLFRMADEHQHYAAGADRVTTSIGSWRVRLAVCYDLRFPVWLRATDDYDVLLCVANWPAARQSAWKTLLRARAVENLCYTVAVNRVGRDGNDVDYAGGSAVYDAEGNTLVEAFDAAAIVRVSLDLDLLRDYRRRFPAWRDADDFEVVQ